jgi:hypothetical protein
MKPFIRPYERRRFKRSDMATRDCRLTLIRVRDGTRDRENCILADLSYAGLRFQGLRPIGEGEVLEFLVSLGDGLHRSGFVRARVRWVRALDSHQCDCGVEFLEESKGLLGPDES